MSCCLHVELKLDLRSAAVGILRFAQKDDVTVTLGIAAQRRGVTAHAVTQTGRSVRVVEWSTS